MIWDVVGYMRHLCKVHAVGAAATYDAAMFMSQFVYTILSRGIADANIILTNEGRLLKGIGMIGSW